ncbi:hypothetical protein GCM10028803_54380 [Larkinella knui]|uniref:Rhodanese-like domain-containing protein n=1 Tax=Larkinella knui TaxID=2025310 RepID=A0A3P1CGG5_9BACT|nr:rhodanese-like domain-containing protein [Larkinella knui]RRB12357.1 rhodanese-like domain-containing protein [Larkinella knui]
MKKMILILFAMSLSVAAFAQDSKGKLSDTRKSPEAILREIQKGEAYLVDVRTPEEYREGHLVNATNIDFKAPDFKTQIGQLDKKKTVYLYCRSGNRSGKAADTLQVLGFKTAYNLGGFEDLKTAGLPAKKTL